MFTPNQNLLEFIGFNNDPNEHKNGTYFSIRFPTKKQDYGYYGFIFVMIINACYEYYNKIFFENNYLKMHWGQIIGGEILCEMIYNAADHGNKNDPTKEIELGVWFGSEGILMVVRDEGDFFKKDRKSVV